MNNASLSFIFIMLLYMSIGTCFAAQQTIAQPRLVRDIHALSLQQAKKISDQLAWAQARDKQALEQGVTLLPETLAGLKKHEVSVDIKKQLDALFGRSDVQEVITQAQGLVTEELYEGRFDDIADKFRLCGFTCLSNKPNILTRDDLPYVVKFPRPYDLYDSSRLLHEELNCSRIFYAERVRQTIKKLGCSRVYVPHKWAYFMPNGNGVTIPLVAVIASKIIPRRYVYDIALQQIVEAICKEVGFPEGENNSNNIIQDTQGNAVFIDTEDHSVRERLQ